MKIEQLRKSKGLTQSELAEKIGITQSAYSKKVSGISKFEVEEIIKLSIILNTTFDEMFEDLQQKIREDFE